MPPEPKPFAPGITSTLRAVTWPKNANYKLVALERPPNQREAMGTADIAVLLAGEHSNTVSFTFE
jgi:hypothetical protein